MNDNTEAQLNSLESIVNQTNVLTSAQVNVGDGPGSIRGIGDALYVANGFSDSVSVIDPATNNVIENIPVGDDPIFIDATRNAVYVVNYVTGAVSVIDPATNNVIENITAIVGGGPTSIATFRGNAYVTIESSDIVSVVDLDTNTIIENISVGAFPVSIDTIGGKVYVANSGSNSISVVDPDSNTVIENIYAGISPVSIDALRGAIYVANAESNSVSVINASTNTLIDNITTVGISPVFIHAFRDFSGAFQDAVYVANTESDTVSVIDPATNTVIENITVGDGPASIDTFRSAVYVANFESDTVSVIDQSTNEVVAGVTFDVIPFREGQIVCNGLDAPINRYFYVPSGTGCVAKPNNGFEFDSWGQIFEGNSSRTINASTVSDWFIDPVGAFRDVFTENPAANFTVNRFGNFTAYFRALPPPVPAEFTASLITVIVAALVGSLLIPAAVSWFKSKKQTSRLNSFHQQMAVIHADGNLDENDINQLNILNKNISDSYAAGKITNDQYTNLKNEVSAAYQKIFKKTIESIHDPNAEAVDNIKNEIEDAYSDRKITELDYNLLIGKISRMFDKKSDIK